MSEKTLYAAITFKDLADVGNGKKKYYYITKIGDLEEGDSVVVEVQGTLKVAYFSEYVEDKDIEESKQHMKWIVDRFDNSVYVENKKKKKQLKELERKIEYRMCELHNLIGTEMLVAAVDSELENLLKKRSELKNIKHKTAKEKIEEIMFETEFKGGAR